MQHADYHHIIKALTYFEDAEKDPMQRVFFTASWPTIKAFFRKETNRLVKQFLLRR